MCRARVDGKLLQMGNGHHSSGGSIGDWDRKAEFNIAEERGTLEEIKEVCNGGRISPHAAVKVEYLEV